MHNAKLSPCKVVDMCILIPSLSHGLVSANGSSQVISLQTERARLEKLSQDLATTNSQVDAWLARNKPENINHDAGAG